MTEYRKKLGESDREIPMTVSTTIELSYQQLLIQDANEKKDMYDILTLLAFFASGIIPLKLFEVYCRHSFSKFVVEGSDDSYQDQTRSIHSNDEIAPSSVIVDRSFDFRDVAMNSICMIHGRWDAGVFFYQTFNDLNKLSLVELPP
jgi:hypothetical protein